MSTLEALMFATTASSSGVIFSLIAFSAKPWVVVAILTLAPPAAEQVAPAAPHSTLDWHTCGRVELAEGAPVSLPVMTRFQHTLSAPRSLAFASRSAPSIALYASRYSPSTRSAG